MTDILSDDKITKKEQDAKYYDIFVVRLRSVQQGENKGEWLAIFWE